MKAAVLAFVLVCDVALQAQNFVSRHRCGFNATADASWSPDCRRYFENLHGVQLGNAMNPPWSIDLITVGGHGSPWLISDPSVNVRSDLEHHFPECMKFDISAVRWISSRRLLISAEPMFCADHAAPLLYTVDVTNDEIVRFPTANPTKQTGRSFRPGLLTF